MNEKSVKKKRFLICNFCAKKKFQSYLVPRTLQSLQTIVIVHEFLKLSMLGLKCGAKRGDFPTQTFYLATHTEALKNKIIKRNNNCNASRSRTHKQKSEKQNKLTRPIIK